MKPLIYALFCLLFTTSLFAQQDPKAKEILDEVSRKYKSYNTIQADFEYILNVGAEDFTEEYAGTIYIKGDKFRLNFGEQTIITDNNSLWIYMEDVNEVQIDQYREAEMEITPNELFMIYNKDFLYRYMGEEEKDGRTLQVIELTPNDKEQSYHKIRLHIDKEKDQLVKTTIFEKSGNKYTYKILNFKPNVELKEEFFQFNKADHPGVTVVDIR